MDSQAIQSRRWYILGVLVVSLLVVVLDNTILNVAMRTIADPQAGLGATQSELEWSINSYTLVFAALLFTAGILGDRFGRKRILLFGMAAFGLASLLSAYAQSPAELIAARAAMGFGAAFVLPATLSIITNVFEPAERPKAIGIWAGSVGLAAAIGPVTGGVLLQHFWWGSVFLVNVPIVLAGLLAIVLVVPESKDPAPGRLDPVGVLLSIVGLTLLVYGIIKGGQLGDWAAVEVWGALVGGVVLLAAFILFERRSSHPALDVTFFRDPRFTAAVSAIGLVFFAMMGVFFFMAFYLQSVRGYSPLDAGLLMLPFAASQLIFAPRSAAMVKRFGGKAVATTGMLIVAVTFVAFLAIDTDTPLWLLGLIFFFQGAGMANVMPPATESIMSAVPRQKAGAASAVNNTIRQVGGALGVAVLGSLLTSAYRTRIEPTLGFLPEDARHAAGESIEATYAVVQHASGTLGPQGVQAVTTAAQDAFVHAMHLASAGSAVVAFLGALVVFLWLPGRESVSEVPLPRPRTETEPVPVRR